MSLSLSAGRSGHGAVGPPATAAREGFSIISHAPCWSPPGHGQRYAQRRQPASTAPGYCPPRLRRRIARRQCASHVYRLHYYQFITAFRHFTLCRDVAHVAPLAERNALALHCLYFAYDFCAMGKSYRPQAARLLTFLLYVCAYVSPGRP